MGWPSNMPLFAAYVSCLGAEIDTNYKWIAVWIFFLNNEIMIWLSIYYPNRLINMVKVANSNEFHQNIEKISTFDIVYRLFDMSF